jgi:uncharacterized protein
MTIAPEPALSACSFIFWPLLALWIVAACAADPQFIVTLYPQSGTALRVNVEIVDTNEKRALGLMYRRELPELQGMLFLFPRQEPLSFWMKNTPLPLDILFIDSSLTIVGIAQNTTPFSEKVIPSDKPAQFVLEVNGGFCQRHGIAVGDRVELPRR